MLVLAALRRVAAAAARGRRRVVAPPLPAAVVGGALRARGAFELAARPYGWSSAAFLAAPSLRAPAALVAWSGLRRGLSTRTTQTDTARHGRAVRTAQAAAHRAPPAVLEAEADVLEAEAAMQRDRQDAKAAVQEAEEDQQKATTAAQTAREKLSAAATQRARNANPLTETAEMLARLEYDGAAKCLADAPERVQIAEKRLNTAEKRLAAAGWYRYLRERARRRSQKHAHAQKAVAALLAAKIEEVPGGGGMRVMRGVTHIDRDAEPFPLFLRADCTEAFWRECINLCESEPRKRVCAVGSPGVGKSAVMLLLVRMLLEMGRTVVYLRRSRDKTRFLYELKPDGKGGASVALYPEAIDPSDIPSMADPNAYMLVDPDETEDSSNPGREVEAHVIINASPDSRRWGDNEFRKARTTEGAPGGTFLYYPLWELEELLVAWPLLGDETVRDKGLGEDVVRERFREFGGAPRVVFGDAATIEEARTRRDAALAALNDEQARKILEDRVSEVDDHYPSRCPHSTLFGYAKADPEVEVAKGRFRSRKVVMVSETVKERFVQMSEVNGVRTPP